MKAELLIIALSLAAGLLIGLILGEVSNSKIVMPVPCKAAIYSGENPGYRTDFDILQVPDESNVRQK